MNNAKQRLETFNDGVMAIIVTIMVLNIKIPSSTDFDEIMVFLSAILVFFISFMIVGNFWNKHRQLFEHLERVNNKVIWRNLLFLFFTALIPIFATWVMQQSNSTAAVFGYGIVSLLVNLSYSYMFFSVVPLLPVNPFPEPQPRKGLETNKDRRREARDSHQVQFIMSTVIMSGVILAVTLVSLLAPQISAILLIGFPLASALLNLLFDDRRETRVLDMQEENRKNVHSAE